MIPLSPLFEPALEARVASLAGDGCPPRLAATIRYALFPPGNRLRPRIAYAVASALGDHHPSGTDAVALAIELLHTASLLQDDLPAFDDADERRGRAACHRAFGEALTVLAADALIIGAFETVSDPAAVPADLIPAVITALTRATGAPHGTVAGQAWEEEEDCSLVAYHRGKTAALFEVATMAPALLAGEDADAWRALGHHLGMAYQLADDVNDEEEYDAPDADDRQPNAVRTLGRREALRRLRAHQDAALECIPPCPGRAHLVMTVREWAGRFTPTLAVA